MVRLGEDQIFELCVVGPDLFMLDGIAGFQLRIERDENARVVRAVGCYQDGQSDRTERDP